MYGHDLSRPPHNAEKGAINRTLTEKVFTPFNRLIGISTCDVFTDCHATLAMTIDPFAELSKNKKAS
jgi:hypothetical protein